MADRHVLTMGSPKWKYVLLFGRNGQMRLVCPSSMNEVSVVIQIVFVERVMSRQMAGRWCCMFSEGKQRVEDEDRRGCSSTSMVSERRSHCVLVVLRPISRS
ncbi:hypothetical protein TNCV_2940781 [Trichonephila clavipes]|nr:hypothetical protein TNCV_2940781 [Trichonephila clavipes]